MHPAQVAEAGLASHKCKFNESMGFTVLLMALIPNWEDSSAVIEWHY